MNKERGSVLILALVLTMMLMTLGLGLTLASLADFSMSQEFESHERALFNAEAGLAAVQRSMRGQELSIALAAQTYTPVYVDSGPTYYRDPVTFREARSVDYNHPPYPINGVQIAGLLTPGEGVPVGDGRYIARISDNDDGDDDYLTDLDGDFFIRVAGIHPGPPQQLVRNGSAIQNAVAMIEAHFERDWSFDINSPFTIYGPTVNPSRNSLFDGNSFNIDGWDHSGMSYEEIIRGHPHPAGEEADQAAISILNDDVSGGDGAGAVDDVYNELTRNQKDNLEGATDVYADASIRDDTDAVRNSSNDDATNLFNPYFLATFIARISAAADVVYPDGTHIDDGRPMGTPEEPLIVVAEGDLTLSGSGSGTGLLVVKGRLEYNGAYNWDGLIMVVGEGNVDFGGANKSVVGGLFVSNLVDDGTGKSTYGIPSVTLGGNSNFFFKGDSIRMAMSLLPFKMVGWREITPEINVLAAAPAKPVEN